MAQKYHEFSDDAVKQALDVAKRRHDENNQITSFSPSTAAPSAGSHVMVAAECIGVTVENNKVCLNLPINLGKHCLPLPVSIPDGTAAQACLDICTKFGIPTGLKVAILVAGSTVYQETFGIC